MLASVAVQAPAGRGAGACFAVGDETGAGLVLQARTSGAVTRVLLPHSIACTVQEHDRTTSP